MHLEIKKAVYNVYGGKNLSFFRKICKKKLSLFEDLSSMKGIPSIQIISQAQKNLPSGRWTIKYLNYPKETIFTTFLIVSKLTKVYYIEHQFEVINNATDRMKPYLEGFDSQPYIKQQSLVDDYLSRALDDKNYTRLYNNDLDETIPELAHVSINNKSAGQMTVSQALFYDFFGINDAS